MTKISFINGQFVPHNDAMVHIDDRGMQFADGVYEVILFYNGNLVDNQWHLERLDNSLKCIDINLHYSHEEITDFAIKLFEMNNIKNGSIYLQITRGTAPRSQLIPRNITPTVIMTVSPITFPNEEDFTVGSKVIVESDIRWHMCHVKSIGLLVGSLLKQKAVDLGYDDAILIRKDKVTECTFSNLFIVDNDGNIITRNLDNFILSGITRRRILSLVISAGFTVQEREFDVSELMSAKEVFSTSRTLLVRPITQIGKVNIGDGICGPITRKISEMYHDFLNNI